MFDSKWMSPSRRNIFEPLYYGRNGSPFLRYWKELQKTQFLSEDTIKERQWRKLEEMLKYSFGNNEFYSSRFRSIGISPDKIKSADDLRLIPILTKEEIRRNTTQMISRGFKQNELLHFKTGGSTGKSLDIYLTEECSELKNACARRSDIWSGWQPGEPIGACWGNPHLPYTPKEKLLNCLLKPFIYLDTMSVTEKSVRDFVTEWKRVSPTLLFGHAHSIYIFAKFVKNMGIEAQVRPKGIIATSMMLMPHERKVIEDVFGVKVTDRYGCEEVSLIGCECEKHEGLHLNIEHLFIEFVKKDGSNAGPGETGDIIVTDLLNKAMPFIRYRLEDVGVPTNRRCSCGRGLPLMESVSGRVADFLVKSDGTRIAGVSLIENTLTKIPGIDQMQIIQDDVFSITLNIVPGKLFSGETINELTAYFKALFGEKTDITLSFIDEINPEPSGKYRFSICRVNQNLQ